MTMAEAASINTPAFGQLMEAQLGMPPSDLRTWLTGDQIIELADTYNPVGTRGGGQTRWLSGPAPLNLFQAAFRAAYLDTAKRPGEIQIWVVNTEAQHSLTGPMSGLHWFVVAFRFYKRRPRNY